ncbi:MAG: hypothetical protein DRN95_07070 [Candidatus Hydrothermarchaeota archaeon]|nr:MAG: hypothetical protein DRN95_07070 [Candidatus Hydrothermarchaeota archaeon]
MIERIGETIVINGEFLNREEIEMMPKLADYLMEREKAKNVVIYGIKDDHLYLLSKCKQAEMARRIERKFSKVGESRKVGDLILTKVHLGIVATVEDRFKKIRYVEEIITETIENGASKRKFGSRLNEIKRLIVV